MKKVKEFQKFIPHMGEVISIVYLGEGERIFVPKSNVGEEGPFEIKKQKVEIRNSRNVHDGSFELYAMIQLDSGVHHVYGEEELRWVDENTPVEFDWSAKDREKKLKKICLEKDSHTRMLMKLFEEKGCIVTPQHWDMFEIVMNGVSIRIYVDGPFTKKGNPYSYQAALSLSPFSGETKPCRKTETLIKRVEALIERTQKDNFLHDSEVMEQVFGFSIDGIDPKSLEE